MHLVRYFTASPTLGELLGHVAPHSLTASSPPRSCLVLLGNSVLGCRAGWQAEALRSDSLRLTRQQRRRCGTTARAARQILFAVCGVLTACVRGAQFVYDLATATAVYRNRISPDPIFLTAASPSTGGFYAINRCAPCAHRSGKCPPRPHGVTCRQAEPVNLCSSQAGPAFPAWKPWYSSHPWVLLSAGRIEDFLHMRIEHTGESSRCSRRRAARGCRCSPGAGHE